MSNFDIENKLNKWLSDENAITLLDHDLITEALLHGIKKDYFEYKDLRKIVKYIYEENIPLIKIFPKPELKFETLIITSINEHYQYNELVYVFRYTMKDPLWLLFAYMFDFNESLDIYNIKLTLSTKPTESGFVEIMEESINKRCIPIMPTKYNVVVRLDKSNDSDDYEKHFELGGGDWKAKDLMEKTLFDYIEHMYKEYIEKNKLIEF